MVDSNPQMEPAQCPSYAAALGYLGVAAAVCLSNWGSAVRSFHFFSWRWRLAFSLSYQRCGNKVQEDIGNLSLFKYIMCFLCTTLPECFVKEKIVCVFACDSRLTWVVDALWFPRSALFDRLALGSQACRLCTQGSVIPVPS